MDKSRWFGRRFSREVEDHTVYARKRWEAAPQGKSLERDHSPPEEYISVIVEEVGKLARVCNKLRIATDTAVREQWIGEGRHRMITTASLVRRLAEVWPIDEVRTN